jgi:DNA-binding HxlR family transcriptional regulator
MTCSPDPGADIEALQMTTSLRVADALPVTVLAVIAGAGSFTHIRDTAARHSQHRPMSDDLPGCAMEASVAIIGGKWKGVILFHLLEGRMRFNELQRQMPGITARLLTKQLRELEEDGLVLRTVYPVVPPKVEYSLTAEALDLAPLLHSLNTLGRQWLATRGIIPRNEQPAPPRTPPPGKHVLPALPAVHPGGRPVRRAR